MLVVDDDPSILDALEGVLSDEGYEVVCASDGDEGLRHLRTERSPEAILLDLFMPRLNGWEFIRQMESSDLTAGVPVIVLTAVEPHWGYPLPGNRVLRKPIRLERLLRLLREVGAGADGSYRRA